VDHDQTFRFVLIALALAVLPIAIYFRVRPQATREPLDRWQEGAFILFTLRPVGIAALIGMLVYMIDPALMAWSSMPLPVWLRWAGAGLGAAGAALVVWAFHSLGRNLTDTVVTRRQHALVAHGPYRWVRHPFYGAVTMLVTANALMAANWFLLLTGAIALLLIRLRTPIEEAKLIERFGEEYRDYMRRTGAVLPRRRRSSA
jgi:protein-S-isoprenylcysteine O-methyltransferase Ste14